MRRAIRTVLVKDIFGKERLITEWEDLGPREVSTFDSMTIHEANTLNRKRLPRE